MHAENHVGDGDQPVGKRRFFQIRGAVETRGDPVPRIQHVTGDLGLHGIDGSALLVHLANISYRLGRSLNFDAETLSCPGDREATQMFTRQYRSGFVVPETV